MGSRLNAIYRGMKTRCYNPNHGDYKNYGARGITVCDEWLDKTVVIVDGNHGSKGWFTFRDWALSHGYSDELTLDRIDNNKGYSPNNCRWVDIYVQGNNKRSNHLITYEGEEKTIAQWARQKQINADVLQARVKRGKTPIEKLFFKGNLKKKLISYKGKTQSLSAWCDELGLNYYTVFSRLKREKMSVEKAFSKEKYKPRRPKGDEWRACHNVKTTK